MRDLGNADPELRATLESLLRADAEAEARLESLETRFLNPRGGRPLDALGLSGKTISHFHVLEPLGSGGMGIVYRAEDTRLRRAVALKFLLPLNLAAATTDSVLREARAAAALDHQNLCSIYEVGETEDGRSFIAMALYRGETLKARLARSGRLGASEACAIVRQIAAGLACAHAAGIVHRDLKPANVMLLPNGTVKVLDFGLAKARDESLSARSTQWGTIPYMSPEQISGQPANRRADLWAIGVMLYEMLTGQKPFHGESEAAVMHAIIHDEPVALATLVAIPDHVVDIIARLLEKECDRRYGTAEELSDDLDQLDRPSKVRIRPPRNTRRRRLRHFMLGSAAVLIAVPVLKWLQASRVSEGRFAPNVLAVAPFDVFDSSLSVWREGLMDVLSRNIDGAGPLKTVSPAVIARRWRGRADPVSADLLARQTGAELVVFGQVLPVSVDSVRLTARVLDASSQTMIADIDVRDIATRMDRLADSATFALLRDIGRTREVGAVRHSSLGSTSLPALRAFLQGEQNFRRTAWDSALAYYEQAIKLDTTFAPALRRIWRTLLALGRGDSVPANYYALRAGAHNRGLSPRDSLLVNADSIRAAWAWSPSWRLFRRRHETLIEATRRYPDDPEAWYALGELRYYETASSWEQVLDTYDRSIQLDSGFAPAYLPLIEVALRLGRITAAQEYIRGYLQWAPNGGRARALRLVSRILERPPRASEMTSLIDTVPSSILAQASAWLSFWPDSNETAIALARAAATRSPSVLPSPDSSAGPSVCCASATALGTSLQARGHFHEGWTEIRQSEDLLGAYATPIVAMASAELAQVGILPYDSARALHEREWRGGGIFFGPSAWWWSSLGDTASLRRFVRSTDSLSRHPAPAGPEFWRYVSDAGRAYWALARHDTSEALRRFEALPDSFCVQCSTEPLTTAQLLAARERFQEAAALLDQKSNDYPGPGYVFWALERGRVNERLGNRDKAIASYTFVFESWRHADLELQSYVKEAREALERLGHGASPELLDLEALPIDPAPFDRILNDQVQ